MSERRRSGELATRLSRWAAVVSVALTLVVATALGFVQEASGDFHWHVVLGTWSIEHGSIYRYDTLSHTYPNAPMHVTSWLGDVLLAAAHGVGGMPAAFALRAFAIAATAGLVFSDARRERLGLVAASGLVLVLLADSMFRFFLRPETFTFPLFAALFVLLADLLRAWRASRAATIFVIVVVWANLHGSVPIAILAIGAGCAEGGVRALANRDRRGALRYGLTLAGALVASSVCPEGAGNLFIGRFWTDGCNEQVEWQPLLLSALSDFEAMAVLALPISAVAAIVIDRRAVPYWRVLVTCGLVFMTVRHRRFATFAAIACVFALVPLLVILKARLTAVLADRAKIAGGVLSVLLLGLALGRFAENDLLGELSLHEAKDAYPARACSFVRAAPPSGNMLNSYNIASYLTYCLDGSTKVAIDQRVCSLYPGPFYRRLQDEQGTSEGLRRLADDLDVTWLFVERDGLARSASEDPGRWRLVYVDDRALVFARLDRAETHELASTSPVALLDPYRFEALAARGGVGATEEAALAIQVQRGRCADCTVTKLAEGAVAASRSDLDGLDAALARLTPAERSGYGTEVGLLEAARTELAFSR